MNRTQSLLLLIAAAARPLLPCDCRAARPACAYLGADAIFLGRVSFTNDDGSGKFTQATLVRFTVEEVFQGLSAATKEVWIDPGSFSSCYAEYAPGERYLVFAQRRGGMPVDSATMTVAPGHNSKPLPPGIDPAHPPTIYLAPECSGTRPAGTSPHIELDLAMLRAYRAGQRPPRVFGWAYLAPFHPWPHLDGPPLQGAHITLSNGRTQLTATTAEDGTFSLADAATGDYQLTAAMPPLVPTGSPEILHVPESGCGSLDAGFRTTSELSGIVLDPSGRPAPKIPIAIEVLSTLTSRYPVVAGSETDAAGRFRIAGIPDAAVRLSYGTETPSSTGVRYSRVYYPEGSGEKSKAATLQLRAGERRADLVLRLPAPNKVGAVELRVITQDGMPVKGASIIAILNGYVTEDAKSDAHGRTALPCLQGLRYQVEAAISRSPRGGRGAITRSIQMVCGKDAGPIEIALPKAPAQ